MSLLFSVTEDEDEKALADSEKETDMETTEDETKDGEEKEGEDDEDDDDSGRNDEDDDKEETESLQDERANVNKSATWNWTDNNSKKLEVDTKQENRYEDVCYSISSSDDEPVSTNYDHSDRNHHSFSKRGEYRDVLHKVKNAFYNNIRHINQSRMTPIYEYMPLMRDSRRRNTIKKCTIDESSSDSTDEPTATTNISFI